MSLESGTYKITNNATNGPVGAEGSSGTLTKVVSFPSDHEAKAPLWKLTKLSDGNYQLVQAQGAAVEIGNLLFVANRNVFPNHATWKIEHVSHLGDDAYIITSANAGGRSLGWVVTKPIPFSQVSVRPLIVVPSFPPQYPPNEVFTIVRVDTDDAN
ncbi:hypothetical protein MD484_g9071, partial [Candolleomyces efflorescens]